MKIVYLPDFKLLEQYGVIKKGSVLIGDNIIFPVGCPDYLAYFKESKDYDSTLYHSYLEYCNKPDAVLISIKLWVNMFLTDDLLDFLYFDKMK